MADKVVLDPVSTGAQRQEEKHGGRDASNSRG
jgi:hypothetical protein